MPALSRILRIHLCGLFFLLAANFSFADSYARIVRVSEVQGDVQIDRGLGQGFEKAIMNLPVTQGTKIRTGENGLAEIEFEDGSAVRITPDSEIDLPTLSLRDSGNKASVVDVKKGMAYVALRGAKDSEFSISFGKTDLPLAKPATVRISVGDDQATVTLLKGSIQVPSASGSSEVEARQSAEFAIGGTEEAKIEKRFEPNEFDSWEKQQDQYEQANMSKGGQTYSPYAYGSSDLNYYGSFFNAPGYGNVWQPYFAGAGWNPFMDGTWAFAPGSGYGWVSSYPWGWTPYHSGSWLFLPGNGWAWQPGGTWNAWPTSPVLARIPSGYKPPARPTGGTAFVPVHSGTTAFTKESFWGNRLVIPSHSAGLGVPRGSLRNLGEVSHTVAQRGIASPLIFSQSSASATSTPGSVGRPSMPMSSRSISSGRSSSTAGRR